VERLILKLQHNTGTQI